MTPEQAKTLGKIEQKLNDMCSSNTKEHDQIRNQIQHNLDQVEIKMIDKNGQAQVRQLECRKMFDSRPKMPLMLWLFGGVFACLIIIGGLIFEVRNVVEVHIDKGEQYILEQTGEKTSLR